MCRMLRPLFVPPLLFPYVCKTIAHIQVPHGLCNLQMLELSSHYRPGGLELQSQTLERVVGQMGSCVMWLRL